MYAATKTGIHYHPFAHGLPAKGIKGADKHLLATLFPIKH
jgi:hypothetical protein